MKICQFEAESVESGPVSCRFVPFAIIIEKKVLIQTFYRLYQNLRHILQADTLRVVNNMPSHQLSRGNKIILLNAFNDCLVFLQRIMICLMLFVQKVFRKTTP